MVNVPKSYPRYILGSVKLSGNSNALYLATLLGMCKRKFCDLLQSVIV